jgi:hypothetical protein
LSSAFFEVLCFQHSVSWDASATICSRWDVKIKKKNWEDEANLIKEVLLVQVMVDEGRWQEINFFCILFQYYDCGTESKIQRQ